MSGNVNAGEDHKPIRVWSVEPLIEELTGPLTLAAFGLLFIVLPDLSFWKISSTNRLGWIGLIVAMIGLAILVAKFVRQSAPGSE